MIVQDLRRDGWWISQNGSIFSYTKTFTGVENSNAIILPIQKIYSISVQSQNDLKVYATAYTKESIENDTAEWVLWNGTDQFSLGITAFKFVNTTGTNKLQLTVKGSGV